MVELSRRCWHALRLPPTAVSEIQKAFNNKIKISGNTWKGISREGIEIQMYLKTDGTNEIISTFPIF
jgi:hypothetical protein